jgi:hypothetical protein
MSVKPPPASLPVENFRGGKHNFYASIENFDPKATSITCFFGGLNHAKPRLRTSI